MIRRSGMAQSRHRALKKSSCAHLFQPFRRGSVSEKTVVPGTGLGLYVCRILTEAQGGTVGLESEVGRGTTVTVRFPLTDGPVAS